MKNFIKSNIQGNTIAITSEMKNFISKEVGWVYVLH